jgi:hypothetical protein
MSGSHGIEFVLLRLPRQRALICALALRDEAFRTLCEDYGLARAALARFEAERSDPPRPEVAEYRGIVADLEAEILAALAESGDDAARGSPPGSPR